MDFALPPDTRRFRMSRATLQLRHGSGIAGADPGHEAVSGSDPVPRRRGPELEAAGPLVDGRGAEQLVRSQHRLGGAGDGAESRRQGPERADPAPEIRNLTALYNLHLQRNALSGPIRLEMANLAALKWLEPFREPRPLYAR